MAVEKMYLVNMVSKLENLDNLLQDVINIGEIEPVDAFSGVSNRNFNVVASAENVDITEDISEIKSFEKYDDVQLRKLRLLEENLGEVASKSARLIDRNEIDSLYEGFFDLIEKRNKVEAEEEKLVAYKNNIDTLRENGIDINNINKLNYFDYRYGKVTDDGRFILKNNYDNIPSLILHLDGKLDEISLDGLDEIYRLDSHTSKLREDTDKILASERANTQEVSLKLDHDFADDQKQETSRVYDEILSGIANKEDEIKAYYEARKSKMDNIYKQNKDMIVQRIVDEVTERRE